LVAYARKSWPPNTLVDSCDDIVTQIQIQICWVAAAGWQRETTPDGGSTYYYNAETGETSWERPAGWEPPDSARPAEAAAEAAREPGCELLLRSPFVSPTTVVVVDTIAGLLPAFAGAMV
jgi:hypothetical protein